MGPQTAHPALTRALESVIRQMEADGRLKCLVPPTDVATALTDRLEELGLPTFDVYVAITLILEEAGWPNAASHAYAVASFDEPRLVADYLRVEDVSMPTRAPKAIGEYAPLAQRIFDEIRRSGLTKVRAV